MVAGPKPVTTAALRAALDDAYDDAQSAQKPLRVQLRTYERVARKALDGGSLAHVSMSARSTAFAHHGPGQITPSENADKWRWLVDTFDYRMQILQAAFARGLLWGAQNPTDAQVYQAMKCHDLEAITETYPDFTKLDLPIREWCEGPVLTW